MLETAHRSWVRTAVVIGIGYDAAHMTAIPALLVALAAGVVRARVLRDAKT